MPDLTIAEKLLANRDEVRLPRVNLTDRTTSYVVELGNAFENDDENARVGALQGGLLVCNSGSNTLRYSGILHLIRLVCLNGMTAPVPGALVLQKRHRGLYVDAIDERLAGGSSRRVARAPPAEQPPAVAALKWAVPDIY